MKDHSIDLPFEPAAAGSTIDLSDGQASGGLVVLAAALDLPERGLSPALVYRFAKPDGSGFYRPMVLVTDEDQMIALAQLTATATAAAIRAAS